MEKKNGLLLYITIQTVYIEHNLSIQLVTIVKDNRDLPRPYSKKTKGTKAPATKGQEGTQGFM